MDLAEMMKRFGGSELDLASLGSYTRWALGYFHDPQYVTDPYLDMTIPLDLAEADAVYRKHYAMTKGASLTAYLIWNLARALWKHECFHYRRLQEKWYCFKSPPIMLPVATGRADRFRDVYLYDVYETTWDNFCQIYRESIAKSLGAKEFEADEDLFSLSTVVGNMPYLEFSALNSQRYAIHTGRAMFYFGKRYQKEGKLFAPFYAGLDHSNADPIVLNALLEDFQKFLWTPSV